ncbi:MAG: FtsQ-type POTRA domain-containing protein [Xanthomonadaceae bacterium]|nr:FtsQ-type POTRA domain-containing protein [Xanthomonadaceae bacterium]
MVERARKGKSGQASRPVSLLARLQPWWPRLGRGALVLVLVLAGVGLVRWTQDPNSLPMRQLQIEGTLRYLSEAELQARVVPHVRGGFFNVDVVAIQRAAQELDWVDRVSVRRVWPDTVRLHVQEQQPVARWGDGALLNPRGERFSAAGREIQVSMQLGRIDARQRVRRFLRAYPSLVASREERLQHVDLRYSNGFAVRWARNGTTES